MATAVTYINPETKETKTLYTGPSWTSLFFGALPTMMRGYYGATFWLWMLVIFSCGFILFLGMSDNDSGLILLGFALFKMLSFLAAIYGCCFLNSAQHKKYEKAGWIDMNNAITVANYEKMVTAEVN